MGICLSADDATTTTNMPVGGETKTGDALVAKPSKRFTDPWWRTFDIPTDGYRDSSGFVNRLPLRLQSTELIVYGFVDADKMWAEFADEEFTPILIGDKAVVALWFNNFLDTDCGGSYLETWYNTFVTRKDNPVQLKVEGEEDPTLSPLSVLSVPKMQSFLIRVLCGDAPGNPGASTKAIHGGREIFGFPKHPDPAKISFSYVTDTEGKPTEWDFECFHHSKMAVQMHCSLPEGAPKVGPFPMTLPVDVAMTAPDACIGAPRLGGSHKGHNGASQTFYSTSLKCTQVVAPWNAESDKLKLGDNEHYAPLGRWGFTPVFKVHSPDFKIAAHKPSGWISGAEALAAVEEHEEKIASGVMAGAL